MLNKDSKSVDFIIFFYDLLVKILLGLAVSVVTLMGFAFKQKTSVFFLFSFGIMFIGCIIYRSIKKWITYFFLDVIKDTDTCDTYYGFLMVFLRKEKDIKNDLKELKALETLDKTGQKKLNKFANKSFSPFYIGTYPALFWTTAMQLTLCVIFSGWKGWSFI